MKPRSKRSIAPSTPIRITHRPGACSGSAWCLQRTMGWIDRDQGLHDGRQHVVRAIALDDCDPWGQIALGYWSMMERRTEESIAAFRRAVSLNPSSAAAHCLSQPWAGVCRADREAIAHGKKRSGSVRWIRRRRCFSAALRSPTISPVDMRKPSNSSKQLLRLRPGFHGAQRLRCASLAQMGRVDEARILSPPCG